MWLNKKEFMTKCNDILDDIEENKVRSPAWVWMGLGAVTGLVMSCFKLRRKTGKPILGKVTRVEDCIDENLGDGL